MNLQTNKEFSYNALRKVMDNYYILSDETWNALVDISTFDSIKKNDYLCQISEVPTFFSYVSFGLLRAFILDEKGNEYNKNFFEEGSFPGSMVALLTNQPSNFDVQALENSQLIHIDFKKYRELLLKYDDLKMYQIHYLEAHWLIHKDAREVAIIQNDADERYEEFKENFPRLESRLPQYHIASHLGITPTQLSRIRKRIN